MLTAADKAFVQFAGDRFGGVKPVLTVEAIQPGSVEIVLGAIDAWDTVKTASALLAPFAAHIGQAVEALRFGGSASLKPAEAKFVKSIVEPVAKGRTQQINIVDSEVHITIGRDDAPDLLAALAQANRPPAPRRTAGMLTQAEARFLAGPGLDGTALAVHGEWYARLLHGRGVLVPITGVRQGLIDNQTYRFQGTPVLGERGETVGLYLRHAEPFGGAR
ncbi:hypothetical protein [Brevundimonas sp.]|uniref:hypothetical protein n=1 Tax=Brevundimonas sp. TaxID=1871086 RepID=UPI0028AA1963|nr:hypothetical protein [Brevundimonas sp.]